MAGPARRETNERAWDVRTAVHQRSAFYDLPAVRSGACTLHAPELALTGDVAGLRVLHLQCHLGADTVSWARRGATVTGVDFSAAALDVARGLAADSGVGARFVRADVQALPDELTGSFDLVVATYGVLCWLEDLAGWSAGIRRALVPGGRCVLVEFHPVLEAVHPGSISGRGSYFGVPDPPLRSTTGTYADRAADISYEEYRWQHPVSAVVTALLGAGLSVTGLHEYPYSPFALLPELDTGQDGRWSPRGGAVYPYLFSVEALRAGK